MSSSVSRRVARLVAETVSAATGSPSSPEPSTTKPLENPYLAGEVIGDRYRLVRELGRGGMGVVWVAHSLVLGVDVALKLIRASVAGPALASRMAREAHAAARLGHPALVRVFDFGWTGRGDPFLVMELVQGETLSALLARETRLSPIRAVQMLLPLADGLRLAHEKGIVHRDIKPDNIFIATDTFGRVQPKLLDFGIAKVDRGPQDGKLTQFGAVLGSPEYMSPEQALGAEDVDERTDIWSLCVVLYQTVTGSIPFRRSNYNALMHAIINDEPTPTMDLGGGDASLWAVIQRGLAKKREQRWGTVTELGEALALWLYEHGIKEDLSGNSLRAVWLDTGLYSARMQLFPSSPPRGVRVAAEQEHAPEEPRRARAREASVSALATATGGRPKRRNGRVLLAVGAGVVSMAAAAALWPRAEPAQVPEDGTAIANSAPARAEPTPAPPAAPSAEAAPPPPASAAPVEASPSGSKVTPTPPRKPTAAPRAPSRASSSPRTKQKYDFGF